MFSNTEDIELRQDEPYIIPYKKSELSSVFEQDTEENRNKLIKSLLSQQSQPV
jgi:hypothetical protein